MDERMKNTAEHAWQTFMRTGQVSDYLTYYAAAHPQEQEEASHANQNPGTGTTGTEYR